MPWAVGSHAPSPTAPDGLCGQQRRTGHEEAHQRRQQAADDETDDEGRSFQASGIQHSGMDEAHATQLPNGQLMMIMRHMRFHHMEVFMIKLLQLLILTR